MDLLRSQATTGVRTRDHFQRTVLFATVVEVKADREDIPEDLHGGLHVNHVLFDGPRSKARNIDALTDGYGEVLMPGDLPIRTGSLVEQNASHSDGAFAEDGVNEGPNGGGLRERTNF